MIILMPSNWQPSCEQVARLEAMVGPGNVTCVGTEQAALDAVSNAEIIIGHRFLRQILPYARCLRWVQSSAAGVDQLPLEAMRQRGIVLTRNPCNSEAVAIHALALLLAMVRRLQDAFESQRNGKWAAPFPVRVLPQRVLLLGIGEIGLALAPKLRALGMRVTGCARRQTAGRRAACDEFVTADRWRSILGRVDAVIMALPLTTDTGGMLGANELARLPRGAFIVNVARAGLIDISALREALRSGQVGGAALDVLDPVPPSDDSLWREAGLIVTPKLAAYHPRMQHDFEQFTELQVCRFLSGEPLAATVQW